MLKKLLNDDLILFYILIAVVLVLGTVFWSFANRPTRAHATDMTPRIGDIVSPVPIKGSYRGPRWHSGTIINPDTGESSYCILNNTLELRVIGIKEEKALLVVSKKQMNSWSRGSPCEDAQEIMLDVAVVSQFKEAGTQEQKDNALNIEQDAKNLALLRALKAQSAPR